MKTKLLPGECILITEGSSSRTSIFSFDHNLAVNSINNHSKLILNKRIHHYAEEDDAAAYYAIILDHPEVLNHL